MTSDTQPGQPLFDFGDVFPTSITILDRIVPLSVRRFSRVELDKLEEDFERFLVPRGAGGPQPSDGAASDKLSTEALAFIERTIRENITLKEGLIRDRGVWVTDGQGLINVFYAQKVVLAKLAGAVVFENRLGGLLRKNSNSPLDSGTGSDPSRQAGGGVRPDSIAASAALSSSAQSEDATASPNQEPDGEKVH